MNSSDPRQDSNAGDTESFRDAINEASEDYDLDPFTETVEDAELDELLGSSNQSHTSDEGEDTSATESSLEPQRGVGIDAVLQEAEDKLGPEYARVIRDLQAEYTRGRQEIAEERRRTEDLTGRMEEQLQRMEELNDEELSESDEEIDQLRDTITDDHRDLFRLMLTELGPEWAEANGYVRSGDLNRMREQQVAVSQRRDELNDSVDVGIERYGNAFGYRAEDGSFILNQEAKEKMTPVYERLTKNLPEGVSFPGTVLDVFEITFGGDEAVRAAEGRDRVEELGRIGGVANCSAGGTSSLNWYKQGESLGKTIRKAAALSAREIGANRR